MYPFTGGRLGREWSRLIDVVTHYPCMNFMCGVFTRHGMNMDAGGSGYVLGVCRIL